MDMSGMGSMNMGGMDMSGMNMGPAMGPMAGPAPAPAPMSMNMSGMHMNDMSSMSGMSHGGDGGMMMMMMWFQATTKATLWFREWDTNTHGKYAGSVVGLFCLCLAQEALVFLRLVVAKRASKSRKSLAVEDIEMASGVTHPINPESRSSVKLRGLNHPALLTMLLGFLYAINVASSYLLMLAIMTYNIGYFLAIVLGLALGHIIFMNLGKKDKGELSDTCCAPHCCAPMNPTFKVPEPCCNHSSKMSQSSNE